MNKKNKLFVMGLILIVLFTISVVSANENATEKIAEDTSNELLSEDIVVNGDYLDDEDLDDEYYLEDDDLDDEDSDLNQIKVSIDNYKKSYNYGDSVKIKIVNNGVAFKNKEIDVYLERKMVNFFHIGNIPILKVYLILN